MRSDPRIQIVSTFRLRPKESKRNQISHGTNLVFMRELWLRQNSRYSIRLCVSILGLDFGLGITVMVVATTAAAAAICFQFHSAEQNLIHSQYNFLCSIDFIC